MTDRKGRVTYLTRNMRKDLRERLRSVSELTGVSMEEVLNRALAIGLTVIEGRLSVQDGERARSE